MEKSIAEYGKLENIDSTDTKTIQIWWWCLANALLRAALAGSLSLNTINCSSQFM